MKIYLRKWFVLVCSAVFVNTIVASENYHCTFIPGGWDSANWMEVKSPRIKHWGQWLQKEDHIRNAVPAKGAGTDYVSLVLNDKYKGDEVSITSTMEFDTRMAPIIVIANDLGESQDGRPEFREHWEVCLYDLGINVWHHTYADNKAAFKKLLHVSFSVAPRERHKVEVRIRGQEMAVRVGESFFTLNIPDMPKEFHAGIIACEGLNRFYDFSIETKNKKTKK